MAFQPKLPGMGRIPRSPSRTGHFGDAAHAAREYSGPMPGQLVMGATDLAAEKDEYDVLRGGSNKKGFREVDKHGFVQDGYGHPDEDMEYGFSPARKLYESHGGRFAKTLAEMNPDESPSDMGYSPTGVREHEAKRRQVTAHWKSQPTVHLPTDTLIHTTQSTNETEGDPYETGKVTAGGSPVYQRTAGGGTRRFRDGTPIQAYTADASLAEGRQRIEAIKSDLASKGPNARIRKPAWVVKQGGRYFSLDGHHRIVAAREAGLSHVPVKLWDRDAEHGVT